MLYGNQVNFVLKTLKYYLFYFFSLFNVSYSKIAIQKHIYGCYYYYKINNIRKKLLFFFSCPFVQDIQGTSSAASDSGKITVTFQLSAVT